MVFYPLTNGSLASWPLGYGMTYDGTVLQGRATWVNPRAAGLMPEDRDELFPGALTCDQGRSWGAATRTTWTRVELSVNPDWKLFCAGWFLDPRCKS